MTTDEEMADLRVEIEEIPEKRTPIAKLKPHPRNYNQHPPEQIEQIKASMQEHGIYRNVVIANDFTILAGHGVVEAATELGVTHIKTKQLPYGPDDIKSLKVLTGDNEIRNLAVVDDRMLTDMLKEIQESQDGLLGTGFDDRQLANLLYVTRAADEIGDMDEAAEWVGMPQFDEWAREPALIIKFPTNEDRAKFVTEYKLDDAVTRGADDARTWSANWPARPQNDMSSAKFVTGDDMLAVEAVEAAVEEAAAEEAATA